MYLSRSETMPQSATVLLGGPARFHRGELTVDIAAHRVRFRGTNVPLRPNEFRLLVHFLEHPDQVLSRASLIACVGKPGQERFIALPIGSAPERSPPSARGCGVRRILG